MTTTYEKKLKIDGKNITARFRLTLGGQRALKEKYDSEMLNLIFQAIDNAEIMADIFGEALSYRGNENEITDGEEMYDILVDNGIAGVGDFAEILFGIATKSGLVSESDAQAFVNKAKGLMDDIIGALDTPEKNE